MLEAGCSRSPVRGVYGKRYVPTRCLNRFPNVFGFQGEGAATRIGLGGGRKQFGLKLRGSCDREAVASDAL